jgi:hypothetical protein
MMRARELAAAFGRRARPYALPLFLSSVLGWFAVRAILERAGRPALPLDDSFIHLQYARRFAEGHPFSFANGTTGYSSGATSFLWPLLLVPFYVVGMHGLTLVYAAWLLGTLFHAALILEAKRLTEPLAGKPAAVGVGAMCLLCGALAWFAWSGMETIAFTWALVRTARVSADWLEQPPGERTVGGAIGVIVMGIVTPLLRPEGGAMSLVAIGALLIAAPPIARARRFGGVVARLPAFAPVAGIFFVPAMNLAFTGHATATTAMVKWYVGNPYLDRHRLAEAIAANVKMFLGELLGGGPYTAFFLPEGQHYLFALGAIALVVMTTRPKTRWRALVVAAFALASFIPCTYSTILWNRVRYIWPYAPSWFVLVACFGKELGELVTWIARLARPFAFSAAWFGAWALLDWVFGLVHPDGLLGGLFDGMLIAVAALFAVRAVWTAVFEHPLREGSALPDFSFLAAIATALVAGGLGSKLVASIGDLATSARAIDHQQVTLGMWAHDNLPADARIGVNDTGAIAYFSDRRTFDVVGLTTEGEARYWVAGAGSRYEHYERLPADQLPTHFIVYPQWMNMNAVLGKELTHATVTDQSILGGATKVAYEARYDVLGRGSLPTHVSANGKLLSEIDVADLESEQEHGYWVGPASEGEDQVFMEWDADDRPIADGGRVNRFYDGFVARLEPGKPARMVMRGGFAPPDGAAAEDVTLEVKVGDAVAGEIVVSQGVWEERELEIPKELASERAVVRVTPKDDTLRFTSLHYWFFEIP